MNSKEIYLYREKLMEFIDLYSYNNEYNIVNAKVDWSTTIWRYMDISKFLSLINSEQIFLSKPQYFRDPFEGAFSEGDLRRVFGEPASYIPDILSDYNAHRESYIKKYKVLLDYVGISCWHMNEVESAAMWDLYLNSNEGIAIKTSIDQLYKSLHAHENIYIGKIQYIDFQTDMASKNIFETLYYKRKSFAHEQELRVIALDNDEHPHFTQAGVGLKIDMNSLIEEIYIHPTAPAWFVDCVRGLLEKYQINKPLIQSTLYTGPSMVW
jgi:hypothetical protein